MNLCEGEHDPRTLELHKRWEGDVCRRCYVLLEVRPIEPDFLSKEQLRYTLLDGMREATPNDLGGLKEFMS